jgi:proteic killer suppression protein
VTKVRLYKRAMDDVQKVPRYIQVKLRAWIRGIEIEGLQDLRKVTGYHDELLLGKRFGQRSIRLNRSYRAIYRLIRENSIEIVEIFEVNKHEY